jgi:DNA-binding transcriptional ArsR family regulator
MPGPRSTRRGPKRAQRPARPRRPAAARAAAVPAAQRARLALEDHAHVERLSRMFRALGDPTRSKMVYALSLGELCVSDLAGALGASLSATSHQLRILRDLDIVHVRRDGKSQRYTLNEAAFGFCSPRVCQAWKSALAPGSPPLAGAGTLVRPEEA